jgi:small subunit ribosomal protein S1
MASRRLASIWEDRSMAEHETGVSARPLFYGAAQGVRAAGTQREHSNGLMEDEKTESGAEPDSQDTTAVEVDETRPGGEAPERDATDESVVEEEAGASGDTIETADETQDSDDTVTAASAVGTPVDLDELDREGYGEEEYEEMLSLYEETLSDIAEGEIVTAHVIGKTDAEIILDVGFKSEGAVPIDEFRDPDSVQEGDEIEVFLESLEDEEGVVVLSKKKADFLRVWEKIKEAYDADRPVAGSIKRKIKGGVTVDLMGVDAFLPGSQIALRRVPNVEDLVGREYDFKILKLNKRRRNIVVSRRVLLEEERADKREELKKELEVGQLRTGIVKNITDFGAFIDLGGMDGLLHITDMSWGRIGHPSEVCDIGQEIEVKILNVDWDRERISLGLKQLQDYPWKDVAEKYPIGSRVRGRVVSITNYGAFIELEKGVEGLVHISEMSWTRNVRHPSQLVTIGEEAECVVLRVDEESQKISLGMKQIEQDPWLGLPAKYPPGTKLKGTVRNLTSFGAFVEVEPGMDGLVPISDMSWTRRVQHPSEVLHKGDEVDVVVLAIDPEQKRISLGLKQVDEDPWYDLAQQFEPGRELSGTVVRLLEKGVVVDLGEDLEGFVPISQLGVEEHIDLPADRFAEGEALDLRVLETDPINRRIVLSVLEADEEGEPAATAESAPEEESAGADETDEAEPTDEADEAEPTDEADEAGPTDKAGDVEPTAEAAEAEPADEAALEGKAEESEASELPETEAVTEEGVEVSEEMEAESAEGAEEEIEEPPA